MKRIVALAVGLGLLGVAGPAHAGKEQPPSVFTTWDECNAVAVTLGGNAWVFSCVPTTGGWTLAFTHKKNLK